MKGDARVSPPTPADRVLRDELLCIADSNWVLGHWYINCILNGRELTDFTSMAGIAEEKLGHARALFRFMEEHYELPEYQLEFARPPDRIHGMEMLDAPPRNWSDFVLTICLADKALWRFSDTLRKGGCAPVASLVTKFGEEAYFHQLCIDGWLKALDDAERNDLEEALPRRLPLLLRWFDSAEPDPLVAAGIRTEPVPRAGERLAAEVRGIIDRVLGRRAAHPRAVAERTGSAAWDARRRRTLGSALPARLWETMVPTGDAAQLARRPLALSIEDNIDLVGAARKDETEPQF